MSGPGGEGGDAGSPVLRSLANERTLLAWQRTARSWAGAGAVITRYFAPDGLLRPQAVVGMLMVVVAALMWLDGTQRYRRADASIRAAETATVPVATIRVVWLATVAVTVAALVVELTS